MDLPTLDYRVTLIGGSNDQPEWHIRKGFIPVVIDPVTGVFMQVITSLHFKKRLFLNKQGKIVSNDFIAVVLTKSRDLPQSSVEFLRFKLADGKLIENNGEKHLVFHQNNSKLVFSVETDENAEVIDIMCPNLTTSYKLFKQYEASLKRHI